MIQFKFVPELEVPYSAIQVGEDVLFVVGLNHARRLEPWFAEFLENQVAAGLVVPPEFGETAEIIDIQELKARREMRRAARIAASSPKLMSVMFALTPLLVACAAPESMF